MAKKASKKVTAKRTPKKVMVKIARVGLSYEISEAGREVEMQDSQVAAVHRAKLAYEKSQETLRKLYEA